MLRSLLLVLFTALPLLADAHERHHATGKAESAPAERARPAVLAAIAAPSRCPGGGHEICCCHDLTGTPSFQPHALADGGRREVALAPAGSEVLPRAEQAPRSVAPVRYSPRGPPIHS